ncbi:MAG: glycosyltransferase family 1 protein [Actinobacteria bacterium]|nr:glycosyltransferase family 1 protein [Actinomycetota bacterium]
MLAVGTAEPRKDLPGLIAAFNLLAQEHKELSFVHVGPDGWGTEALEQAIANSPFKDRIIRTGYLDDAALAKIMKDAALLAYPSIYEGFGFPPLQAMKIGTPVVASDTAVLRETIGNGGLLVAPGSPESLADAMASILDNAEQRTALIEGGRSQAARFTWEQCGVGLSQIYAKVAQER